MNIVLVGDVCIDQNRSEQISYTNWGSALMYMAYYFRHQFELEPTLIANYGPDFEMYRDNFRFLPAEPNRSKTLVMQNDTNNGYRQQHCFNADDKLLEEATEVQQAAIAEADIIVLAPLLPNMSANYVRSLLKDRRPGSLTALLPQGYFRSVNTNGLINFQDFAEASEIVTLFDLVIFSEEDYPAALDEAKRWAYAGPSVIMTQGSRGATYVTETMAKQVETDVVPTSQVIDSVGCGDTFAAAAIFAYYPVHSLAAATAAGNRAARQKLVQAQTI